MGSTTADDASPVCLPDLSFFKMRSSEAEAPLWSLAETEEVLAAVAAAITARDNLVVVFIFVQSSDRFREWI